MENPWNALYRKQPDTVHALASTTPTNNTETLLSWNYVLAQRDQMQARHHHHHQHIYFTVTRNVQAFRTGYHKTLKQQKEKCKSLKYKSKQKTNITKNMRKTQLSLTKTKTTNSPPKSWCRQNTTTCCTWNPLWCRHNSLASHTRTVQK